MHALEPSNSAYVPTGHGSQGPSPAPLDVPGGHGVHSLAPAVADEYPAGHDVHDALPLPLKVPTPQGSHSVLAIEDFVPAGQASDAAVPFSAT